MTFCYDGQTKDMPSHNYGALAHVLNKYFGRNNTCLTQKDTCSFPKGREFDQWLQFSQELHAKMMLYLHPTIEEIRAGNYDRYGNHILEWASNNEVLVCNGLEILPEIGFRDNIHLNECGQRQLADLWVDCIEFPVDTNTARTINS